MRFSERCASATRLPLTIVATARALTIWCHATVVANAWPSTRNSAANAAAFTAVAMKPVTGVGAPS